MLSTTGFQIYIHIVAYIGIFSAFGHLLWLLQFDVQRWTTTGPLLFSNIVQPLLPSLQTELVLGYLDDFSLGGHQNQVARDVQQIIDVGVRMGLSLNVNKVIADPDILPSRTHFFRAHCNPRR